MLRDEPLERLIRHRAPRARQRHGLRLRRGLGRVLQELIDHAGASGFQLRGVVRALQYAKTLAGPDTTVRGVFVETDPARTAKIEEKWGKWGLGVPLIVLTSPYRSLLRPLLDYLDQIQSLGDEQMITIVLPEFLPRKWWQHILHNQTALLIKGALLFRKNTVVADVPYLLKR